MELSEIRPFDTVRAISAFTGGSRVVAMRTSRAILNPRIEKNSGFAGTN